MHGHWLKDYIGPKASASGGGTALVVKVNSPQLGTKVLDKTWQEIYDAMPNVVLQKSNSRGDSRTLITGCSWSTFEGSTTYVVNAEEEYVTQSADGYPTEIIS